MALCLLGLLLLAHLGSASSSSSSSGEIHGCGGFVQASSGLAKTSHSKFDFSDITVELCTQDGLVKESTQCAPNGYYFIPLYHYHYHNDNGKPASFLLRVKGPTGWSWDPEKVPVLLDHNGCNANADINFKFTGFMISGQVLGTVGAHTCQLNNHGPSGVRVDLLSPSGDLLSHVFTSHTGHYSFPNVIPGNYKLSASHADYEIETRGSTEVKLGFGNAKVDDFFFVSGYNVDGSIVSKGNPISGVNVYLYSNDVSEVHCPKGFGDGPRPGALCHAVSDADGNFVFTSLPCGTYELLPYYKGDNTVFDVSPPSLVVSVAHHHLTIPQKFEVTGFSVAGRVVDSSGAGIGNAKVILDGKFKTVTDGLGYYKLDQVTSKQYSIAAEKDHYKFSPLENFMVLPNMASVDDIKAISYDVCGVVRMISTNTKAMVALTHGPENVKPQKKLIDENGKFCFEVPPGEYRLAAVPVASSDSFASPVFAPSFLDVKVESPLLDLEFSQSQVSIHGEIICKEKCSSDVSLSLVRLTGGSVQDRKIFKLGSDSGAFVFSKVLPGKYILEVTHAENKWCWDHNSMELDVGPEDMKGIVFTQTGYWIDIVSTHHTGAFLKLPDSSKLDFSIVKGSQRICLGAPGKHELHFVNPCINFGDAAHQFDTRSHEPIHVRGQKYLVTGEIQLEIGLDEGEEITVDVLKGENAPIETISAKFVAKNGDEKAIYGYSTWAGLGDDLVFIARDASSTREKKILFYPTQRQFSVATSECQKHVAPIVGKPGLYLQGSVTPPLSGVKIQIISLGKSSYTQLQEGSLAAETDTNSDGVFSAGPLYDDISYKVEASKSGYHILQTGDTSFECLKLGQIEVRIHGETDSETGMIPSVLLSLSGDNGYRNNTVSGTGGAFTFTNLFPGSFYLRPVLKEYSFSPRAMAIDLESGETQVIDFHATRVAFSAMGKVTLLSGQPKEGVFIEARSESEGFYEEATTDKSGYFRLRGLIPDTTYLVKVVPKETPGVVPIERSSPEFFPIHVGHRDTTGVDFVAFEMPEMPLVTGHVEGDDLDTALTHLSVEVRSANEPSRVETVISLPLSGYFEIRDLSKSRHLIQLRSGLPTSSFIFDSEPFEIDLRKQPQVHVGPLSYKIQERHHKQDLTPAPVLPLVVGVSVVILFISMPRLTDLYQMTVGMANGASSSVTSKKEAVPRKPGLRRRA
ncbi:Nodal modulator 1 [Rhynchospora pubera]|uniref:Nodal modulator 1 n=1 Tax=Rhynchospora pubera TaxID=906938 RepID=A0AAV8E3F1_9POAL|nr:Nodal modulator 1 [Rhynchospora pubera]